MSDPFRDRVALITGGAGGIGMALAHAFAARGARLLLVDLDGDALAAAERSLHDAGAEVRSVIADVTSRESVEALAEEARARMGGVHLLCNNAGVATFGPMHQSDPRDWDFTMDVNFWGVVHGVQAFLPRMLEAGQGGHVLNTASMAGLVGMQYLGVYCASKFAVVGLSESLHRELRPQGIGVSVLCPMIVETNLPANTQRLLRRSRGEPEPPPEASDPGVAMRGGVVQPAEVAARVVRAIERGDLYVLTHPEQREILQRRAARLDACFAPERWELEPEA